MTTMMMTMIIVIMSVIILTLIIIVLIIVIVIIIIIIIFIAIIMISTSLVFFLAGEISRNIWTWATTYDAVAGYTSQGSGIALLFRAKLTFALY